MLQKFRIRSYEKLENNETLFTVEEAGVEGHIRLLARDLLFNKKILYAFEKKDIVKITYTAACDTFNLDA